jgi:hypothetical protein
MLYRILLLITVILLLQITSKAQNQLEAEVGRQIEQIKKISGTSDGLFEKLPATNDKESPVSELIGLGMDAVPHLAPYLSDDSLMQAFVRGRRDRNFKKQIAVNEYVIYAIRKITDYEFYLPSKQNDSSELEKLERQVVSWWQENHTKTLLERKIEEVNDPVHTNRFNAYKWLGREKAKEARIVLEQRIETLLTGEVNSLKQEEMAECAKSLAEIGDADSISAVEKVCKHFYYWMYRSYRPSEEGRSATDSGQITRLFKAYRAFANLGQKDEALSSLKEIENKYLQEMELSTQKEFLKNLTEVEKW